MKLKRPVYRVLRNIAKQLHDYLEDKVERDWKADQAIPIYHWGNRVYQKCPCPFDGCFCRSFAEVGVLCDKCADGLHVFESVRGNPTPHRRRAKDADCHYCGPKCNWPGAWAMGRVPRL